MSINEFLNIAKNIKSNSEHLDTEMLINFYHDLKDSPLALHMSEKRKLEKQSIINASNKTKGLLFAKEMNDY